MPPPPSASHASHAFESQDSSVDTSPGVAPDPAAAAAADPAGPDANPEEEFPGPRHAQSRLTWWVLRTRRELS